MIPHIPDHAPFSPEQRSWLNGFFAGLFSVQDLDGASSVRGSAGAASEIPGQPGGASGFPGAPDVASAFPGAADVSSTVSGVAHRSADPVTILFGSQTGTAEGLARTAAGRLKEAGTEPAVRALDECPPSVLADIERLLVITSTHGDGEMPDNAEAFWESISSDDAPSLERLSFSVLALGDSSYLDFCQAGKDLDARLEELGARRLQDRVDCDVDVDEPFETWLSGVMAALPGSESLLRAA